MARKFLIDIGLNDTLENVIRKVNYNFRLMSGDMEKQATILIEDAENTIQEELDSKANINSLASVAFSGSYNDLENTPNLATVAISGDYADLSNLPDLSEFVLPSDLSTVATSGDYNDLINTPIIPPGSVVDPALDPTSANPVQNMAIANALALKADQALLALKVDKSGDTMTGTLAIQSSNIDCDGGAPSAKTAGDAYIILCDADDDKIGNIQSEFNIDSSIRTLIRAITKDANDNEVSNTMYVGIKPDGTKTYYVSDPAAFRAAISSAASGSGIDAAITKYSGSAQIWGLTGTCVNANNTTANGKRYALIINNTGISLYNATDQTWPWGMNLPLSIENGGTSCNEVLSTTVISNIATAGTNVTITSASWVRWGKIGSFNVAFKPTAAIASGATVFTMVSGKRPAIYSIGNDTSSTTPCSIGTDGKVICRRALTSGTTYTFRAMYIIAN